MFRFLPSVVPKPYRTVTSKPKYVPNRLCTVTPTLWPRLIIFSTDPPISVYILIREKLSTIRVCLWVQRLPSGLVLTGTARTEKSEPENQRTQQQSEKHFAKGLQNISIFFSLNGTRQSAHALCSQLAGLRARCHNVHCKRECRKEAISAFATPERAVLH